MKSMASRIGLSFLLLTLLFASGAAPARAEAITIIENTVMSPVGFGMLVTCAAGGTGEMVDFTGNFHYIYSFTGSSGGPVHYQIRPGTGCSGCWTGNRGQLRIFRWLHGDWCPLEGGNCDHLI